MLQQGLPPDACDYDGRTAIMLAAGHGHTDAVKALLSAGADPSAMPVVDEVQVDPARSTSRPQLSRKHKPP